MDDQGRRPLLSHLLSGGTQYRTYTMGAYVGDSPLGPFRPQPRNPIFRSAEGLVTGAGHGCFVHGPRDRIWGFYTVFACVAHGPVQNGSGAFVVNFSR